MAYYNGTAADQAALMTALVNACLANGWSKTNAILRKGNLFIRPFQKVDAGWGDHLFLQMGKSCDVPETSLVDVIGAAIGPGGSTSLQPSGYPVNYDIHVFDNEVFLVCWDAQDRHFWVAFGQSSPFSATPPAGCNLWLGGTQTQELPLAVGANPIVIGADFGGTSGFAATSAALFWSTAMSGSSGRPASVFTDSDGAVNGGNAVPTSASTTFEVAAIRTVGPLLKRKRSAMSQGTLALPIQLTAPVAATSNRKLAIEVQNALYFRLDVVSPRALINIDGVSYKVYPWYKRDVNNPDGSANGSTSVAHTGNFGWAIKYTGV